MQPLAPNQGDYMTVVSWFPLHQVGPIARRNCLQWYIDKQSSVGSKKREAKEKKKNDTDKGDGVIGG
jgi:hypothetical protein